jgi:diguanylate cyclase (GGDEF)-like protein
VLDIDHFKAVNDTYGHSAGDNALGTLAELIIETWRRSDIAFPYRGEEFTLILSNTDRKHVHLVAERSRIAIAQLHCPDGTRNFGFTISLGVTELARGENITAFFDRAVQALYQAKKQGRNNTVLA